MRTLHFVVASAFEAKTLAKYKHPITISGTGYFKAKAAAAKIKNVCCVNFGFAGGKLPLGTLVGINQINTHYDQVTLNALGHTITSECVASVHTDYKDGCVYEMESYGIYQGINNKIPLLIFKIITDNQNGVIFSQSNWEELIENGVDEMNELLKMF